MRKTQLKNPRSARARLKRRHQSSVRHKRRRHRQPLNGGAAAQAHTVVELQRAYREAKATYHALGDRLFASRGGNE